MTSQSATPRALSIPERTDMVEIRESAIARKAFRRCSEAGASRGDGGNKKDGQPDQRTG